MTHLFGLSSLRALFVMSAFVGTALVGGCPASNGDGDGDNTPVEENEDRTLMEDAPAIEGGETSVLQAAVVNPIGQDRFVTSRGCAMCHSNNNAATAMRNAAGEEIAPFNLWRGTMMANSARDPFWRAVVSAEVKQTPMAGAAIEAECMRCHAPMASEVAHAFGEEPAIADLGALSSTQEVANDGVSCTVCHQIQPDNLGRRASFNGNFVIEEERRIFGPHLNPAIGPMVNHVDYTPTYATHVTESSLCATCHTLETHALRPDGTAEDAEPYPEQSAYLEWKNSIYYDEDGQTEHTQTCQSCHMPTVDEQGNEIETRIARSPPGGDFNINPRKPFGRHIFVGANTLIPKILRDEMETLNPQYDNPDTQFDEVALQTEAYNAVISLALDRLQGQTAVVNVENLEQSGNTLDFDVKVISEVGHKFPTGFPSRRAWIKVEVLDADGNTLWVSGQTNDEGRITDMNGKVLDVEKANGPYEPHRTLIKDHDEVQIFEQVPGNTDGELTHTLLRATQKLKDNRLLPLGFKKDHEDYGKTKPTGAEDDADFVGGEDAVHYSVDVEGTPARVVASVQYQSLGGRFMQELFQNDTPEIRAFKTFYDRQQNLPVEVASDTVELD